MKDVSIATISLARNEDEEKILRNSLSQLANLNLPVYITDGGSSESFLRVLSGFSNFTVLQSRGLWRQAKTSITAANKEGRGFIFYTEPDKQQFFSDHLVKMLGHSVDESTGVVLASRSFNAFTTFPLFQQMTETTINQCCSEVIGKDVDYCYGPFLFNSQLIPFLELVDDNCGWGWRPFLFTIAHRLGLKIENFEGDFNCPPGQLEDNDAERIYRMKQLTQNINELIKAATIDLKG